MPMTHVAQAGHSMCMYMNFYYHASTGLYTEMMDTYHQVSLCGTENKTQDLP